MTPGMIPNAKDLKTILWDLGSVLLILGGLMSIFIAVPLISGEYSLVPPFVVGAIASFALGLTLREVLGEHYEPSFSHAMITAALAWLVFPLISTLPFLAIGMTPLQSFFEAMSGWTGTGLTMIIETNQLPMTIQFWRSTIQWIGGVGVIVLTLTIIARPGTGAYMLYRGEAREEKIHPSIVDTVQTIWKILILFTALAFVLFVMAGMPPWDALNHAMTGIATGGFSITGPQSIGFYNNPIINVTVIPIMLLGAIPFLVHYRWLTGEVECLKRDIQTLALFILVIIGSAVLIVENTLGPGLFAGPLSSVFQFVSAITCTGFQTAPVGEWSATSLLVLSAAMIVGGAAGSTAGGIKLIRAALLYKGVSWWFRRSTVSSRAIFSYKLGDKMLSEESVNREVSEASLVSFLWILFLLAGVIILLHVAPTEFNLEAVIFEVASAQGNVGLSTGITGPGLNPIGKASLILNMWIGRLEIIPVLMLFRAAIKGMGPI